MRLVLFAAASATVLSVAAQAASAADAAPAVVHYGTWGVDLTTEDKSIAPGDNFYRYAEGAWLAKAVMYGRPPLGKWRLTFRRAVWSGHVFGLLMRSMR